MTIDTTNPETIRQTCSDYQASRTSDYAFRCIRYDKVFLKMLQLGFVSMDGILDIGCGNKDFAKRLGELKQTFFYHGLDGAIDGRDLNEFTGGRGWFHDFVVAIEVIEHLNDPDKHLHNWFETARKAVVITTPNPRTVDVLGCDPTHVSVVTPEMLEARGYNYEEVQLFGKPADSLLAWKTVK